MPPARGGDLVTEPPRSARRMPPHLQGPRRSAAAEAATGNQFAVEAEVACPVGGGVPRLRKRARSRRRRRPGIPSAARSGCPSPKLAARHAATTLVYPRPRPAPSSPAAAISSTPTPGCSRPGSEIVLRRAAPPPAAAKSRSKTASGAEPCLHPRRLALLVGADHRLPSEPCRDSDGRRRRRVARARSTRPSSRAGAPRSPWRVDEQPLSAPVQPDADRAGGRGEPRRLRRPSHQLRRRRPAYGPARGLLRGPCRRRRRPRHHRRALHPRDRLAIREDDPRLPPRCAPRLQADHRGGPPPRDADLRPDQPRRRPGLRGCTPPAPVWSASPVADPMFPRGGKGGRETRRSPRSSPAARPVAGRCVEEAVSTASSCSARTPRSSAASSHERPTRRSDRYGGALANRARLLLEILAAVREAVGRHVAVGVRLCGDELIEEGDHDRGERWKVAPRRKWSTATTSTPRSVWRRRLRP